jgi:hypothetical protein
LALTKPISLIGGFGVIKSGTVMGKISESTNRAGYYVPYTIEGGNFSGAGYQLAYPGLTYIVADVSAATTFYVTMSDSYRFAVGDHLGGTDSDGSKVDLGAITAIDRTTYSHIAAITITNSWTAATIAKGGMVWHQTTTSDPYTAAAGILLSSVDTGVGANCKGAQGTLVVSNAVLYKGRLTAYCADAATDLSSSDDGKYVFLK